MKTTMPPRHRQRPWLLHGSCNLRKISNEDMSNRCLRCLVVSVGYRSLSTTQTIADFGTRISTEMLHDVPTWVCLKVVKMNINHGTIRHIHVYLLLIFIHLLVQRIVWNLQPPSSAMSQLTLVFASEGKVQKAPVAKVGNFTMAQLRSPPQ
jgi:hypothetical protein